jgi:hypothetical protein
MGRGTPRLDGSCQHPQSRWFLHNHLFGGTCQLSADVNQLAFRVGEWLEVRPSKDAASFFRALGFDGQDPTPTLAGGTKESKYPLRERPAVRAANSKG